ncbi:MAG TPA: ComEC/Rec2 family competence protein [Coleofasciculaceae cyanobacterium]|jgi:competence protein ComEC
MNPATGALLSLAFILGLLSTASLGLLTRAVLWKVDSFVFLSVAIFVLGVVAAIAVPRFWRTGPRARLWIAAGIVAALAPIYFQMRVPQPTSNDISQFVRSASGTVQEQVVTVQGKVESIPRLTRSSRGQFWLKATQLNEVESINNTGATSKGVTGKLYVTVPLLQATGLYPDQNVAVTGVLYKPKPTLNPGAFDFGAYLAREGTFAGFSGRQVTESDTQQKHKWGWWVLRQQITRSQVRWLGSPAGQLLSSMVLGNRAVDIPYDIRDQFVRAGLAHTLAASGFQTSLILGLVVALTKRFSVKTQLGLGTFALVVFVCLTGLQPSVMRAALMGIGALVALVTQRQVKPLGSLLVAATLLLLFNPLWIWDLGFQLSFLATLGLLVTVPPLSKQLDWLPPAITSLITIPLAASLWTLPLQLYVFGMVAPYSLAANITSAPLITVISIGGVISALAALISPIAGSAIAFVLSYPTQILMALVRFFNELPGSAVALGTISLIQLLLLYGLIWISSISARARRRWWLAALLAVALVALPVWKTKTAQFRVTVLATAQEQVLVIQDHAQVALVNSGETDTVNFTVLPFLQQQGVNQIDWAVALDSQPRLRNGWLQLLAGLPVKTFYDIADSQPPLANNQTKDSTASFTIASTVQSQRGNYQPLSTGQSTSVGSTTIELINAKPPILRLQIRQQSWLLLGEIKPDDQKQLLKTDRLPPSQVLWWSGELLTSELLEAVKPKVAIASSNTVDSEAAQLLRKLKIPLYWTGRDGAVQWTPNSGFETTLEAINSDASLL